MSLMSPWTWGIFLQMWHLENAAFNQRQLLGRYLHSADWHVGEGSPIGGLTSDHVMLLMGPWPWGGRNHCSAGVALGQPQRGPGLSARLLWIPFLLVPCPWQPGGQRTTEMFHEAHLGRGDRSGLSTPSKQPDSICFPCLVYLWQILLCVNLVVPGTLSVQLNFASGKTNGNPWSWPFWPPSP